jgi:hypothetical protein
VISKNTKPAIMIAWNHAKMLERIRYMYMDRGGQQKCNSRLQYPGRQNKIPHRFIPIANLANHSMIFSSMLALFNGNIIQVNHTNIEVGLAITHLGVLWLHGQPQPSSRPLREQEADISFTIILKRAQIYFAIYY